MKNNTGLGLLILRVGIGLMIVFGHGLGKFVGYSEMSGSFPDPIGAGSQIALVLAIFAEFICGALLTLGIGTRLVAIPLLITMAVAFFIIHAADPFPRKELALIYGLTFLTLIFTGGGMLALGRGIPGVARWS